MTALHTEICDRLGCRFPIIQTGMGWVGSPELVAAVCEAGAFGFLAAATLAPHAVEAEIEKVTALTGRPFLELIRQRTEEYGVVFILDEVKTGFRIANGGAQEYYGIQPDLATYAKALGNGYTVAAFGGNKEIMSIIGQGVAQGGTYTNNKPGVARIRHFESVEIPADPANHCTARPAADGWLKGNF